MTEFYTKKCKRFFNAPAVFIQCPAYKLITNKWQQIFVLYIIK